MPRINYVFDAIESERDYQKKTWPNSKALPVLGEMTLLREYMRQFDKHYQESDDGPEHGVPELCLHDLRKMAAILVRAMENSAAPGRLF